MLGDFATDDRSQTRHDVAAEAATAHHDAEALAFHLAHTVAVQIFSGDDDHVRNRSFLHASGKGRSEAGAGYRRRNVCGHAEPHAVLPHPDVGVTTGPVAPILQCSIGGTGVNDGDVAEQTDDHVMRL